MRSGGCGKPHPPEVNSHRQPFGLLGRASPGSQQSDVNGPSRPQAWTVAGSESLATPPLGGARGGVEARSCAPKSQAVGACSRFRLQLSAVCCLLNSLGLLGRASPGSQQSTAKTPHAGHRCPKESLLAPLPLGGGQPEGLLCAFLCSSSGFLLTTVGSRL
jgi:hypothetical protein